MPDCSREASLHLQDACPMAEGLHRTCFSGQILASLSSLNLTPGEGSWEGACLALYSRVGTRLKVKLKTGRAFLKEFHKVARCLRTGTQYLGSELAA